MKNLNKKENDKKENALKNKISDKNTPVYFASKLTDGGVEAFICHWDQVFRLYIHQDGRLELMK